MAMSDMGHSWYGDLGVKAAWGKSAVCKYLIKSLVFASSLELAVLGPAFEFACSLLVGVLEVCSLV